MLLELFKSNRFADVSLNQWMALTPSELVQAHLKMNTACAICCAIKGGLVILIALALAACSSGSATGPNTSSTPTTATATASTSATPSSLQNVRDLRYCEDIP